MRTSIWYRTEAKNPDKSGFYLSYRGFGMGGMADSDSEHGYMYYDQREDCWLDHRSGYEAIVYYWTDADPNGWVDQDPPSIKIRKNYNPVTKKHDTDHPAVADAWSDVEEAIKRYETVKTLCQK